MASVLAGERRTAEDPYDSDEITVLPPPTRSAHQPLRPLDISQAQNKPRKRRRLFAYVLLPRPKRDAEASPTGPARSQVREAHTAASLRPLDPPVTPLNGRSHGATPSDQLLSDLAASCTPAEDLSDDALAHSGAENVYTVESSAIQSHEASVRPARPKRAVSRPSYVPEPFEESSEDELAAPTTRGQRREPKAQSPISVSDSEGVSESVTDSEVYSATDESDAHTSDASDEVFSQGEPVRSAKHRSAAATQKTSKLRQTKGRKPTPKGNYECMKNLATFGKEGRGLDLNFPPLSNINDIFEDLTGNALKHGLRKALQHIGRRSLRVATMCSGTESPLLALQMIQEALESSGLSLHFDHQFSAEIVPYKQSYIERNFRPKIIFRDIREFVANEEEPLTATTAYGAKVKVPTNVDLVIAGTSCVDYSRLNRHKKGIYDGGESGDTFLALLKYCEKYRPAIVILENVVGASWDKMADVYRNIGYETAGVIVDTKQYYIPQTRQRGYMVCFNTESAADQQSAGARWQELMKTLQRKASEPAHAFLTPSDAPKTRQVAHGDNIVREMPWDKCELTVLQYRQDTRLGNGRTILQWQESGVMSVPEKGDRQFWMDSVERVKDFWECAVLRKALPGPKDSHGFDIRYKSRVLDVSQNISRALDNVPLGVIGCITPRAQNFLTHAGCLMAPEDSLKLQGLPLERISFTTESPTDIQDLAGNAMSTTVIGSAILSALISGYRFIGPASSSELPTKATPVSPVSLIETKIKISQLRNIETDIDATELLAVGRRTLRKCFCEGARGVADKPIQQCNLCAHTTCVSCGGNPPHDYKRVPFMDQMRTSPHEFEQAFGSTMPLRLHFKSLPDLALLTSEHAAPLRDSYVDQVTQALSSTFTFSNIRRTYCWTVTYYAKSARLELVIDSFTAEWRLFARAPANLPANHSLRKKLQQPVGRCRISSNLFSGKWLWADLSTQSYSIKVRPQGSKMASFWSGMPDFEDHWVPQRLQISVPPEATAVLGKNLSGVYEYAGLCGKALNSLFRRLDDGQVSEESMFLFLDPTLAGSPDEDAFVFNTVRADLEPDEIRPVIARIHASWRPWGPGSTVMSDSRTTLISDTSWKSSDRPTRLQVKPTTVDIKTPVSATSLVRSIACNDLASLVQVCVANAVTSDGKTLSIDSATKFRLSVEFNWVLEAIRRALPKAKWRRVQDVSCVASCNTCAPRRPTMKWKLERRDDAIIAYENPADATVYERAIKHRPSPFLLRVEAKNNGTLSATFAANPLTLAHRALSRLPSTAENIEASWRLVQTAAAGASFKFRPFKLSPPKDVAPSTADVGISIKLFPPQQVSLAWMKQQEAGLGKAFVLEENEEATVSGLDRTLEARARGTIHVRGGICADHPAFGKTVISLALIHTEFQENGRDNILEELKSRRRSQHNSLLASAATVICCPTILVSQWRSEIREKLGYDNNVIVISKLSDMDKHSIEDMAQAKIIVVSRSIFSSDIYAERIAAFAGAPGPAAKSGRPYSQWLQYVTEEILNSMQTLLAEGAPGLKCRLKSKYHRLMDSKGFEALVPSRRTRGKVYVAEKAKKKTQSVTAGAASSTLDTSSVGKPFFEMFYFNRVIVDELHDCSARELAHMRALCADKRWGLSATPALDDLFESAQLATLLGITLPMGSDARGKMKLRNSRELRKHLSDSERFQAMLETPSEAMQERIYQQHQRFLDAFVSRNIMDFPGIKCHEYLVPVNLDVAHRAVYTELSEHLNSREMRLGKGRKTKTLERDERLHAAVKFSATAEEALSKAAAFPNFDSDSRNGSSFMLPASINRRKREVESTRHKLITAILDAQRKEPQAFESWRTSRLREKTLGDDEVIAAIEKMVNNNTSNYTPQSASVKSKAQKSRRAAHSSEDGEELDQIDFGLKALTAKVHALVSTLLSSMRSLRFLENVAKLDTSLRVDNEQNQLNQHCSSSNCDTSVRTRKVAVSALCGHLSKGDQAIVFVQYPSQLDEVERALAHEQISAIVVKETRAGGQQIANFRDRAGTSSQTTVIVLNASDETAAGSNLQNANHVIFLSPLLRDSQYGYDSTKQQAIGRVRRYGQRKPVHVYNIVALDTIDVDILEHRERRSNAITEEDAPPISPPRGVQSLSLQSEPIIERTQLVLEKGIFSLRPQSWLVKCGSDEDLKALSRMRSGSEEERVKGKSRVAGWEDFSSLVKFSKAYTEDDD